MSNSIHDTDLPGTGFPLLAFIIFIYSAKFMRYKFFMRQAKAFLHLLLIPICLTSAFSSERPTFTQEFERHLRLADQHDGTKVGYAAAMDVLVNWANQQPAASHAKYTKSLANTPWLQLTKMQRRAFVFYVYDWGGNHLAAPVLASLIAKGFSRYYTQAPYLYLLAIFRDVESVLILQTALLQTTDKSIESHLLLELINGIGPDAVGLTSEKAAALAKTGITGQAKVRCCQKMRDWVKINQGQVERNDAYAGPRKEGTLFKPKP